MISTRGSWGTSCSNVPQRRKSPFLGPKRSRRRRQARRPGHRAQLGCRLMVDSVQRAMERLLAAAPEVLAALACGFAAAGPSCSRTGSCGNVAGGGVGAAARPSPLWGQHSSAQPPDFRAVAVPWLVTPSLLLARVLSMRAFRALPTRTIRTVGGDASNFGTHSVRPGAGAALFHADAPRPLDTQALQHASAWTDESYILESAELTAVAVAPRMPPSGRPPGAATTLDPPPGPGVRSNGISAPPAGRLRLLPAGAPQHGGPSGARMAGVVAPLGGFHFAARRQPPPPLVGSGGGAAACGRSMFALPAAAYGRGTRLLTDMERGCLRRRSSRLLLTDAAVPPYVRTAGWHGPDRLECGRP